MARPAIKEEDQVIETWEICTEGSIWVWTYDKRDDRYRKQRVGGRAGSRRLHISRDDRKFNQEQLPSENAGLDVFTNGSLRLLDSATRDEHLDARYHLSDAELSEMFEIRDIEVFMEGVRGIESEVVIRRLQGLGETIGTAAQNEALNDYIRERYPIGGTQRTVREMIEAGEKLGSGFTRI